MATRKSTIEVVIDSSKAKSGAKDVQNQYTRMLKAALAFSKGSLAAMTRASTSGARAMKSMTLSTVSALKTMKRAASSTFMAMLRWYDKSIASAEKLKQRMAPISSIFSTIKSSLTSLKTAAAGGVLVVLLKELVQAGLLMQRFRTTLTVITGSAEGANKELSWLRDTVDRVGISFAQAAQPFARFAAAADEIFDAKKIHDIFGAFAEASAALHLSEQEISGVFLALQQMVSKGKISMEELRLQLAERIPGAMRLAADSMGTTITDLEDQIRRGALSTEDFLGKYATAIHNKFGSAAITASATAVGAFSRLRTAVFHTAVTIAESGMMTSLADGATRLATMLDNNKVKIENFGKQLSKVIKLFVDKIINLKPEDVSRAFVSLSDAMGTTYSTFVAISNSTFFQWLVGKSKKTVAIEQLTEKITKLKTEFATRPLSFDYSSPEKLALFNAQLAELESQLKNVKDRSDFLIPALTTLQDVASRNKNQPVLVITDQDYQDQINAVLLGVERLKDPATTVNKLFKQRNDLTNQSLELLAKVQDKEKYSAEKRRDFALEYRRVATDLIAVQSQLNDEMKLMPTQFDLAAEAAIKLNVAFNGSIDAMNLKIKLLDMAPRKQFIYNKVLAAGVIEEGRMKTQVEALAGALYDKSNALKSTSDSMDGATAATTLWQHELEALDDSFLSLWRNGLDSFEDFKTSLVNSFKDMIAQLIHQATTKKILLSIGGLGGSEVAIGANNGIDLLDLVGSSSSSANGVGAGSMDAFGAVQAAFSAVTDGISSTMQGYAADSIVAIANTLESAGFQSAANEVLTAGFDNIVNASWVDMGATAAAGIAGRYAGNFAGREIFGKEAESNIGAAIGGAIGSIWGYPGAFVGSAIGSLADVAFGGDGKKRVKLGVGTGSDLFNGGSVQDTMIASSGLELTALAKRVGDGTKGQSAIDLMNLLGSIDEVLTSVSVAAGHDVDLSGVSLSGRGTQGSGKGPKTGFGSFGFNSLNQEALLSAPKEFIQAWIEEVADSFDGDLKGLVTTLSGTADEVIAQYSEIMNLQSLIAGGTEPFRQIINMGEAFQFLQEPVQSTYDLFRSGADALSILADNAEPHQVLELAGAVSSLSQISQQLVYDIANAKEQISGSFGSMIDKIQYDLLESDKERYNYLRAQADTLAGALGALTDPAQIQSTSTEIASLTGRAYGALSDGSQQLMAPEIMSFLESIEAQSQAQLDAVTTMVTTTADPEAAGSVANSIEAALSRWQDGWEGRMAEIFANAAKDTDGNNAAFSTAVQAFAGAASSIPDNISVNVHVDHSEITA